ELDIVHGDRSPKRVPIYIGATGMKMMELAGEIGDGVVLNYMVSPAYNRGALEALGAGAARAGRTLEGIDRPQLVVCSLDQDRRGCRSMSAMTAEAIDVLAPRTLHEALEMKRDRPEAVPIAGGTDLMVAVNFDRLRPTAFMDISRLSELQVWSQDAGRMFLGAGVTYARIIRELPGFVPLVQASRTVGSPQIRNRATVGGNLGTASPAGD